MLVASSYLLPGFQLMATSVDDYERSQVRTNREAQRMRLITKRAREPAISHLKMLESADEQMNFFKRTLDCIETAGERR